MLRKIFVSIFMVVFLSACSDSSDSDVANVGSNGLPVSMSIYPDVSIIKGAEGKEPRILLARISAPVDQVTAASLRKWLVYNGFNKYPDVDDDRVVIHIYTKNNVKCYIFDNASIEVTNTKLGVDIKELYTYFQPVLKNSDYVAFIYDYFDETTLNAYISGLEAAGFQKDSKNIYNLNGNVFYSLSSQTDGYSLEFLINK